MSIFFSIYFKSFKTILNKETEMKFLVKNTPHLKGVVNVPGNKSGTARGVIIGSLAGGVS